MGRRILKTSDVFFPWLLGREGEHHYRVTKDPLPADTRIVNVQCQFIGLGRQDIVFLLESSEWEPAKDGDPYPEISPAMETIYPKGA
jgi:hypothetical protein